MRYGLSFLVAVALVGWGDVSTAAAQPGGPRVGTRPPTYSPYLNLLRRGNSPAVNYYGLVRPEFQARQSFQSLQTQVGTNSQAITDLATGGALPTTGKTVGFMTHGSYFQNSRPGGSVGAGPSTPRP